MAEHVVQSPEWGQFKAEYGTPAIRAAGVQYTKHEIPFTAHFYGYCPRVNPFLISFDELAKSADENACVAINFDVPNVVRGTKEEADALALFTQAGCVVSPRDQFAKGNILVDLTGSEDEIFTRMHSKRRYNIRYSQKSGVVVKKGQTDADFNLFYKLYRETAVRQKYYPRSEAYLKRIWQIFGDKGMCTILISMVGEIPLAAWMLLVYDKVLYFPYGGSSLENRNLFGSELLGWESMRFGKQAGCHTFDMWGTAEKLDDPKDPYYGFTNFKLKFGGQHVVYMDSYDFVVNKSIYKLFTTANTLRWKILNLLR